MFSLSTLFFGIFLPCYVLTSSITVRVVTWNVADNTKMDGGFTDKAIDTVLGLDRVGRNMPELYAIGLQENCWMCSKQNFHKIGERFLQRINHKAPHKYKVIDIYGTRVNSMCESECLLSLHGSTILLVIGQISISASSKSFNQIHGCSSNIPRNHEKGVAAMKVRVKGGKKTLCFAAAHLDADSASYRRNCLKTFYTYADKKMSWSKDCHAQFLFADFNTRTGDKTKGPTAGKHYPKATNFNSLKVKDEFSGAKPYGTDSHWKSNLLSYINNVQTKKYNEGAISFMPTYSIKPAKKYCNSRFPCYRTNRPLSWTDRIAYTSGTLMVYDAVFEEFGDHFAVFAEFKVNL